MAIEALDIGLLQAFSQLIPALLVWVVTYMLFEKLKLLGEGKGFHAIIALVFAFFVLISREVSEVINFIAPWFILLLVFVLLLFLIYMFMGVDESTLSKYVKEDAPIKWFVFFLGIIIIVSGLGHVYGQGLLGEDGNQTIPSNMISAGDRNVDSGSYESNVMATLFDKKVLGLVFVFVIAIATIVMLTREV